jgi:glyoxylase-like metal-dependent hydrolase (beta-lactamase superfamily II)
VRIAPAEIVLRDGLELALGSVRVQVRHVGGDHADGSTVIYVEPDGPLFLGDCLYEAPSGGYTVERLGSLVEAVRGFDARLFVEGHSENVLSAAEFAELVAEAARFLPEEARQASSLFHERQ